MGQTGYKVILYIDDNPNSSGYGQTWTERVWDISHCPVDDVHWVEITSLCEATTSGYTGYKTTVYYNELTGQYSSTTVFDSSCPNSSMDELWVDSGDPYCEMDEQFLYTGYQVQHQVQRNSNLLNYGEERDERTSSSACTYTIEPVWEEIYRECHVVADEFTGRLSFDGTANVLQIDVNPSSSSFNETRTVVEESEDCNYTQCDDVINEWIYQGDYCGSAIPAEWGLITVPDTKYYVYQMYSKCIIDGQVVKTTPTDIYSGVTSETGVTECVERWIETDETVCIEEAFNGKWLATYTGGTTSSAECDSSSAITNGEIVKTDLVRVEIGQCVKTIGQGAFEDCSGLTSVTMSNSVTTIGDKAFEDCSGLTSVTIPNSVTSINDYEAFAYCTSLTSITIPDSVTRIGSGAFNSCSGLTSVTIGSGVTSIGDGAFSFCNSLTSVTIPDSVTSIGVSAFYVCKGLTSVTIGSGVTTIGGSAFLRCSGLTSVTMSNSVTTIGDKAFRYCSGLTSVTVNATTPPTLGTNVFDNTNTNLKIYVPCSSVNAYKTATNWSTYADRIEGIPPCIPPFEGKWLATYSDSHTESAECDSSSAITSGEITKTDLESVEINDCVTSIGNNVFQNCSSLTSVTISDSVTNIGRDAFSYSEYLESVNIPSGLTSISSATFYGCSSLISIDIPNGVTNIGPGAFRNCNSLTTITIPSSVTNIGNYAFYGCNGLTSITCLATTPPVLGSWTPLSDNNCVIYVPSTSVKMIFGLLT